MIRWALKLSGFNIEWEHRPGVQNVVADLLSRNPVDPEWKLVDVITRPVRPGDNEEDATNKAEKPVRSNQTNTAHTIYGAVYKKRQNSEELSNIEINGHLAAFRRSLSNVLDDNVYNNNSFRSLAIRDGKVEIKIAACWRFPILKISPNLHSKRSSMNDRKINEIMIRKFHFGHDHQARGHEIHAQMLSVKFCLAPAKLYVALYLLVLHASEPPKLLIQENFLRIHETT
ncbi:hypothetical protein TNCV_892271 [Trichonephila clavipes]|nr:hypothetical protein TNCV_892271 [Trichonephila clavipes]